MKPHETPRDRMPNLSNQPDRRTVAARRRQVGKNGSATIRTDRLSGWELPPPGALKRGDIRPVRCFSTAAEAIDFIARTARQKRYRSRVARGSRVARIEVDHDLIDELCRRKYLEPGDVTNWREVEAALQLLVTDWRAQW